MSSFFNSIQFAKHFLESKTIHFGLYLTLVFARHPYIAWPTHLISPANFLYFPRHSRAWQRRERHYMWHAAFSCLSCYASVDWICKLFNNRRFLFNSMSLAPHLCDQLGVTHATRGKGSHVESQLQFINRHANTYT